MPDHSEYVALSGSPPPEKVEQDSTESSSTNQGTQAEEVTVAESAAAEDDDTVDTSWQEVIDIAEIETVEEMHDLIFKVSSFLVQDKQLLSKWISGVQQGFATLYIQTKRLNVDAKELELLKEFFASRIETLKLRIEELLNEREDYTAMHESDSSIKEHLISRMNELDKQIMEKTTEGLF